MKTKISVLFRAYQIADRVNTDPSRVEDHGVALVAWTTLSVFLERCEIEVEIPSSIEQSIIPLLVREEARI